MVIQDSLFVMHFFVMHLRVQPIWVKSPCENSRCFAVGWKLLRIPTWLYHDAFASQGKEPSACWWDIYQNNHVSSFASVHGQGGMVWGSDAFRLLLGQGEVMPSWLLEEVGWLSPSFCDSRLSELLMKSISIPGGIQKPFRCGLGHLVGPADLQRSLPTSIAEWLWSWLGVFMAGLSTCPLDLGRSWRHSKAI